MASVWLNGERQPTTTRLMRRPPWALEALAKWLLEYGVESVAVESIHIYWVPVYALLESYGLEVLLVNARHLSRVVGLIRKDEVAGLR